MIPWWAIAIAAFSAAGILGIYLICSYWVERRRWKRHRPVFLNDDEE